MKTIPLTYKTEVALVDDEDYKRVIEMGPWHLHGGYARACKYIKRFETKTLTMHRFVLGLGKGIGIIDHINRNKLDNRKENLRLVSAKDNIWNTERVTKKVYFEHGRGWRAIRTFYTRKVSSKYFKTREEAIAAYAELNP